MRNKTWLGLLAAGPMSPALFRIPNLHVHLGPVAAATLRVASRLANRLKAGIAVQPECLGAAELIIITGPEVDFPDLLRLALSAGIDWKGRTAILLDFRRDASDLQPLRELGASTGTLDSLDAFPDLRFVADADDRARRRLQQFATASKSSIFFLEQGRKQVFSAGSAFTGTLLTPLVAATVDCLKKAGLSHSEALLIAERNTLQALRAWFKSGRKGWTGSVPDRDHDTVLRQLRALSRESEVLSHYFSSNARLALTLFGEDPTWLDALSKSSSPIIEAMDETQAQRLVAAGRLAANLAHDWNNLLTLLAAQAGEIVYSLPLDHPARPLAAELSNSIEHAADSPRRLLSWLRNQDHALGSYDLNVAIRSALPLVQLALGRGVACNTDLFEAPIEILLDQPLFLNALLNLASNASAAMNGRGAFTIRTAIVTGQAALHVEDSGPGMDEATKQQVFEPFFSTRHASGGTGLGLETVKTLVESHRAQLTIDTAPGQGCRFTLLFPLLAKAQAASA
jgi:signal transduction histidine kinase